MMFYNNRQVLHVDNETNYMSKLLEYNYIKMAKRAKPEMFRMYKLCILLYRTFNEQIPENDWLSLNFEQANTSRQTNFNIRKNNQLMVGMNILNNRFHELNNVIPLDWFNMSINCFKISCKNLFLTIRAV